MKNIYETFYQKNSGTVYFYMVRIMYMQNKGGNEDATSRRGATKSNIYAVFRDISGHSIVKWPSVCMYN